ncbi:hypothetical protein HAX54_028823 [Datura stramonium]|uniref:Uncharacterized protein n=1 Tax=Datura stramonium TaxID=4076 RepID=A0ABS8V4S2_DATST|nr:hypothetical protein [Datura stramonium]
MKPRDCPNEEGRASQEARCKPRNVPELRPVTNGIAAVAALFHNGPHSAWRKVVPSIATHITVCYMTIAADGLGGDRMVSEEGTWPSSYN